MKFSKKMIDQKRLVVDLENFRIGEHDSVRDAYRAMIEEEGFDLANLAEDIIEHRFSPDPFYVVPHDEQKDNYTVIEGNRRLTALRLLETPSLAAGTKVHRRFVDLAEEYAKQPMKQVECAVFPSRDAAFIWMERKHLDLEGRGIAKWNSAATGRAYAHRGQVRAGKAVVDHLRSRAKLTRSLESKLAAPSNLDRVFAMPYVEKALGVAIRKDGTIAYGSGDEVKGDRLLLRMLEAMSGPDFNVNNIRTLDQRKDLIDSFVRHAVVGGAVSSGSTSKAAAKKATKTTKPHSERKTLALKGRSNALSILQPRLQELYSEAQTIEPDEHGNASGMLTRVFLELTLVHFLKSVKASVPHKRDMSGRSHWGDSRVTMAEKVKAALQIVDPEEKNRELRYARTCSSDAGAIHAVQELHDFMHGLDTKPSGREVKRIWERFHPFFVSMYEHLGALGK